MRRLAAMAEMANVEVVQPMPYFPLLRPLPDWAVAGARRIGDMRVAHQRMFYVPGLLKSLDGFWLQRSVRESLFTFMKKGEVDAVDAHFGYPDGVGCVRAAREFNIPVFVTVRGLELDRIRRPLIRNQLVAAMNDATGCISVSYALRDALRDAGVKKEKIRVIPNAVDRQVFRPGDRHAARNILDIPPDARVIVTVGHLITGKRHDILIRAFGRLRARRGDVLLAIIGGEDHEPGYALQLRKLAREIGVLDSVRFVGPIDPKDVVRWLHAADLFALATAREGCCNAVLEALATGIPVVTTPAGDNAVYVTTDVNGRIVPVGDVEALFEALDAALGRPWDAVQISKTLPVGDWSSVAREVLNAFAEWRRER